MPPRPAYFKRLLKFLRRKGRSHEDAEDLIQEAMLRLHVYGRAAAVANEEAFLRHTVRNLSIDQHRRERTELRSVPVDGDATLSALADGGSNPERAVDAQQRLAHVSRLLDAASRRTREIYFAHRAGYSYAEIAEHMAISQVTIKRHITRALLVLMEHEDGFDHEAAARKR